MNSTLIAAGVALALGALGNDSITQVIDTSAGGQGELSYPVAIAMDRLGNAYVPGGFLTLGSAFQVTPGGAITEIIGSDGDGQGNTLDDADAIAVDNQGFVYVAGSFSDNVFKITPGGRIVEIIDGTGDGTHSLQTPTALAVDAFRNVYVACFGSHNVFKITPAGAITEIIDVSGDGASNPLFNPSGIAVDDSGNVYVTSSLIFTESRVLRITPEGEITQIIDGTGDGLGNPLALPYGLAVKQGG